MRWTGTQVKHREDRRGGWSTGRTGKVGGAQGGQVRWVEHRERKTF